MPVIQRFLSRLFNVLRPDAPEPDLAREIAAHLALLQEDFERRGMTPSQARLAANREFGRVEQTKDLHRDARSFRSLDDARRDLRHAWRLLRRNPLFAATAILSLAIGIGANTTIFTVANALLLKPPSGVIEPRELVDIGSTRMRGRFGPSSYPNFLDIRNRTTTLAGVYTYSRFPHAVSFRDAGSDAEVENISATAVSTNYFTVLGVVAAAGRVLGPADSDETGGRPVAVLSHRFWSRRFDRDPTVVGRTLRLNGHPVIVVGVAAEAFRGTGVHALDVWVPMSAAAAVTSKGAAALADRSANWLLIGARLKPGVAASQAAAELELIGRTLETEYPEENRSLMLRLLPASPVPGNGGPVIAFVGVLTVIVALVLIVACANVAGVLLARAGARRQEMALRVAIGAGRARLVRQLLTETLLLFLLGGMTGLLLARGMTGVLMSRLPTLPFPVVLSLTLDARVVAFTVGLSLAAALLCGLAPALQASRAEVLWGLKTDQGLVGRLRLRHAFVVCQVAVSIVLIIAAGLFVRALQRAASVDLGFDPSGVEVASVDLAQGGFSRQAGSLFARDLLERVHRLPGVEQATIATSVPGGFEVMRQSVTAPGGSSSNGAPFDVDWNAVEPGYFLTLRSPLPAGRDFSTADRDGTQPVAIVSESAARLFWPGRQPVGEYLLLQRAITPGSTAAQTTPLLVIGIARDLQSSSLIDGVARPSVYAPLQQQYLSKLTIVVRTTRGQRIADQIRTIVAAMNPNVPMTSARTLEESVALGLTPQRVAGAVSAGLGLVCLMLAAIGVYGVTAYAVSRRTREFGIRIALGARRADIVGMVLREGLVLTLIGSALGLLCAAPIGQVLAGFLFGIPPLDPATFVGAAALFVAIGLAACYVPVRRALRIDPTQALRYE
jgi:predicted permease